MTMRKCPRATAEVGVNATDVATARQCELAGLKIFGLRRLGMDAWPDDEADSLVALAGTTLCFTAITRSRFPIGQLRIEAECVGLTFECRPVTSVAYPEKASLIPDPVSPVPAVDVPGNTTMMFLVKADIPAGVKAGRHEITIRAISESHLPQEREIPLSILPAFVAEGTEWRPQIVFWPDWRALCDYYGVELWSEPFWQLADKYVAEMARGGNTAIMISIKDDPFQYPLPGRYYRHHDKPCPIRWTKSRAGWEFDYSCYDRYIELFMKHGMGREIECHSLLPCKCQAPVLTYFDREAGRSVEVQTTYDAPEYREAWRAFLTDFYQHNEHRGWADLLTLCPYDEPTNPETFRAVALMARAVVPNIRITAAIQAGVANTLTDVIDIATVHLSQGYDRDECRRLREAGVELRWYNCCFPDWGNTLFSCGLADSYRLAWITLANDFGGYLRWSIFDFTRDVLTNPGFNWPTGDMHLLYPGKNGPATSLRWETFKVGRHDAELAARALRSTSLSDEKRKTLARLVRRIGKDEAIDLPADCLAWRHELYLCLHGQ